MITLMSKIILAMAWAYCLYQDAISKSVWWFIGDFIIAPMGIIRGFLMFFGIL